MLTTKIIEHTGIINLLSLPHLYIILRVTTVFTSENYKCNIEAYTITDGKMDKLYTMSHGGRPQSKHLKTSQKSL